MSKTESSNSATVKFETALRKAFFAEYTMLQDKPHVQVDKDFRAAFQAGVDYERSRHEVEYTPHVDPHYEATLRSPAFVDMTKSAKAIEGVWTTNPGAVA